MKSENKRKFKDLGFKNLNNTRIEGRDVKINGNADNVKKFDEINERQKQEVLGKLYGK